jgi:hypothetical protein
MNREAARAQARYRNLNAGIREGLLEKGHRMRMGSAIWLFARLVCWQTKTNGLLWGGHPFSYEEIAGHMDESPNTVRKWMQVLKRHHYVKISYSVYNRMVIYIAKPKKFTHRQLNLMSQIPVEKPVENRACHNERSRPRRIGQNPARITSTKEQKKILRGAQKKTPVEITETDEEARREFMDMIRRMATAHDMNGVQPEMSEAEIDERRRFLQKQARDLSELVPA